MKKVLFVATITGHIKSFHIPYLKWFKEQGYEVHVASSGDEEISYSIENAPLSFRRGALTDRTVLLLSGGDPQAAFAKC